MPSENMMAVSPPCTMANARESVHSTGLPSRW